MRKYIAILFIVAGIFIASKLFFYYDEDDGEIPFIVAEEVVIKERPDDPGGAVIPNMDKSIYDSLSETQKRAVARALPDPEKPVAINKRGDKEIFSALKDSTKHVMGDNGVLITKIEEEEIKPLVIEGEVVEGDGAYMVQIGHANSIVGADVEWQRLQKRYHDLLSGQKHKFKRRNVNSHNVIYSIMVGPFYDEEDAIYLCKQLWKRGRSCILFK